MKTISTLKNEAREALRGNRGALLDLHLPLVAAADCPRHHQGPRLRHGTVHPRGRAHAFRRGNAPPFVHDDGGPQMGSLRALPELHWLVVPQHPDARYRILLPDPLRPHDSIVLLRGPEGLMPAGYPRKGPILRARH